MPQNTTHRVRTNIWRNGRLTVHDEYFESLTDALNYSQQSPAHAVKIYDGDSGQLVHAATKAPEAEQLYAG